MSPESREHLPAPPSTYLAGNTIPVRYLDYNDTYFSPMGGGGHPMRELAAAIPAAAAIFEGAMASSTAFNRHVTTVAGRYFRARGGGIGPGIPGAIGLKLAKPELPVLGVV